MTTEIAVRQHEGETAVYQWFLNQPIKRIEKADEARIEYLQVKKELAKSLGLNAQVGLIEREIKKEKSPVLDTPAMTSDEMVIWRAFLPTAYWYQQRDMYGSGDAQRYEYDAIPYPVLAKWQECRNEGLFDTYEIWSPEIKNIDPALVGYVGERCYMLARWAESDANLVTFTDIKRELVGRWLGDLPILIAIILGFIAAVISIVAGLVQAPSGGGLARNWMSIGNTALFVSYFTVPLWLGITSFEGRKNAVIRAIVRHTMKKGENHG